MINIRWQFHQRSMYSFYARRSQSCLALLGPTSVKAECKTVVKLTPSGNFINVVHEAFTHIYPKSANKTVTLSVFFELLESECVKAAYKALVKLTPDRVLTGSLFLTAKQSIHFSLVNFSFKMFHQSKRHVYPKTTNWKYDWVWPK